MSDDPTAPPAGGADEVTQSDRTVTFREVFALPEYRTIYFSLLVNWVGDYLSRAAVTVLVYQQSQSVLLSAAAFAVTFLPWIIGGTVLSALADRYPYRRVLITSDLCRMVLIGLLLVPGLPVAVLLLLLFLAGLGAPPTQAARSALLPQVVGRQQLPTAIAANATTTQAAQVTGYLAGATLATALSPQVALGIDVLTFALSAALLTVGLRPRPAARSRTERSHLLRESGEGFRLVFGWQTLRWIAILVFVLTGFAVVPEGLAAAWAAESGGAHSTSQGLNQGLIMAAGPIGFVVGGILVNRLLRSAQRDRLVRPLAVLSALALVPAVLAPPPPVVAVLVALAGICQGGLIPTLNSKFVLILPHGYRARAYGVMQTGMQLSQFAAVIATGVLADRFGVPLVVGLWSIGGAVAMTLIGLRWPSAETFAAAVTATDASPAAATTATPPRPAPGRHRAGNPPGIATTSVTPERP